MTTVHFQIGRPSRDGPEPSRGELWLIPTRRIAVGKTVILPAPCVIPLDRGEATAQLTPTDPRWCWKIVEHTPGGGTRHVSVPDSDQLIDTGNVNDADNAKLYVKGTTAYTYLTDLSGATGMTGPQGPQGLKGETGAQGVKGETGPQGLKGETGATGPAGKDGSQITSGAGAPATGKTGKTGDMYLDTTTGDLYIYEA